MPSRRGDDAAVLDRAFDALLEKLAKQKFAATDKAPRFAGDEEPEARTSRLAIKRSALGA